MNKNKSQLPVYLKKRLRLPHQSLRPFRQFVHCVTYVTIVTFVAYVGSVALDGNPALVGDRVAERVLKVGLVYILV